MWNTPGSKEEVIKGVILITGDIEVGMNLEETIAEGTGIIVVVIILGGITGRGGVGLTGGEEGDTSETISEEDFSFFVL